jgi:DNA-binding MarR family transcriptional regulator
VVADVWRLMIETAMAQFGQASSILQPLGLTPGHLKLLMQIHEGEARPMGSLAQVFQCDASTMTWLVDRLEEKGLAERQASPTDRRVKTIALTDLGVRTRERLAEAMLRPPEELVELDLASLDALRAQLEKLPSSTEPLWWQRNLADAAERAASSS